MSFRVNTRLGVVAVRPGGGCCRFVSMFRRSFPPWFRLSSVVVRCQFSRNSCRRGLLPFSVNVFAVRSVGFGSSPFFVNPLPALGIGVSLTYFVKFRTAADYYFPLYIKIKRPKWLTVKMVVTDCYKEILPLCFI